jgi:hypothetical protein
VVSGLEELQDWSPFLFFWAFLCGVQVVLGLEKLGQQSDDGGSFPFSRRLLMRYNCRIIIKSQAIAGLVVVCSDLSRASQYLFFANTEYWSR